MILAKLEEPCWLWMDVFHYGPWCPWWFPPCLWEAVEAQGTQNRGGGSSVQPTRNVKHDIESSMSFSRNTPKVWMSFLGGGSFLSWIFSRRICWNVPFVSCNSGLGLGLGFGFCLNLDLHWMKPGHHLSGNHFLGGAGGLAGHSSNYFMSYFGCWNTYIVFSCPSSPTTTCDSNSTRTKTISPIFHWFSMGQQKNPPLPIPNQFERPFK